MAAKSSPRINFDRAAAVISLIDRKSHDEYVVYWDRVVRPRTKLAAMRRWLFSFASVHTTWQSNVSLYNKLLKVTSDDVTTAELVDIVKAAGAGMHTIRSRGISAFVQNFWSNESLFCSPPQNGDWAAHRNELESQILGLGLAKTTFALEMCWPVEAQVVCLDTHMFQLYGLDQRKSSPSLYAKLEQHWVETCKSRGMAPTICRHVFWDRLQGQNSAHYWASVFAE